MRGKQYNKTLTVAINNIKHNIIFFLLSCIARVGHLLRKDKCVNKKMNYI